MKRFKATLLIAAGYLQMWIEAAILLLPIRSLRRRIYARHVREHELILESFKRDDDPSAQSWETAAREELEYQREQLAKYQ